jgi:hypothetical protein
MTYRFPDRITGAPKILIDLLVDLVSGLHLGATEPAHHFGIALIGPPVEGVIYGIHEPIISPRSSHKKPCRQYRWIRQDTCLHWRLRASWPMEPDSSSDSGIANAYVALRLIEWDDVGPKLLTLKEASCPLISPN